MSVSSFGKSGCWTIHSPNGLVRRYRHGAVLRNRLSARRASSTRATVMDKYSSLSYDELLHRVVSLESQLKTQTELLKKVHSQSSTTLPVKAQATKRFESHRYSTHLVALKFAYLGRNYQGFEHHSNNPDPNALPTIEEELWRAMMRARLIFPTETSASAPTPDQQHWEGPVNWIDLEYSKCGRTDRGVSAFGQVVVLRMRSNKPSPKALPIDQAGAATGTDIVEQIIEVSKDEATQRRDFDPVKDEIDYPAVLNRILPHDIRILGWCPAPRSDFNARFSCRERRYRYFFAQPPFLPLPDDKGDDSTKLDIEAMREAASYLVGSHDFRNFCKIDASKQLTNFTRRITHASIDEVANLDMPGSNFFARDESSGHKMFALRLHGSAFLWHQVRCIVAVLFLVGQRLESPTVIKDLLDMTEAGLGRGGRPVYDMADDKPLVLWDCIYPVDRAGEVPPVGWQPTTEDGDALAMEDSLQWITPGTTSSSAEAIWGRKGLYNGLWDQWSEKKMNEHLAASFFSNAASFCGGNAPVTQSTKSTRIFCGGAESKYVGKYTKLLARDRMETPDVLNARYAARKGIPVRTAMEVDDNIGI